MSLLKSLINPIVGTDDADVIALADIATNGIYVRTGNGTSATREITSDDASVAITYPDGVSGDIDLSVVGGGGGGGYTTFNALDDIMIM